jgi:hypothetical protein
MVSRNQIIEYLIDEYYEGDAGVAARRTGQARQQIEWWLKRKHQPNRSNVDKLIYFSVVQKFEVVAEFAPLRRLTRVTLHKQLSLILKGHERVSGLYAFYDSMANLIYLGKTDGNMLHEVYQQIKSKIPAGILPKAVSKTAKRLDVVRYISAYSIPTSDHADHAKHVEALILRISKPRLNKNLGALPRSIKM